MDILLILIGIVVVLRGADNLTDGTVRIARRFNMSELIIGLTIVALGTSMPELCVSITSAMNGTAGMAVGNVIGSNTFNIFFIVGLCAIIHPMSVGMSAVRRDLPFCFAATLLLLLFLVNGTISLLEGLLMLSLYAAYTAYTIRKESGKGKSESGKEKDESCNPCQSEQSLVSGKEQRVEGENAETAEEPKRRLPGIFYNPVFKIVVGLAELVIGSNLFVDHATLLAVDLGVSETVIGITILGFGTSLPEFATSFVAALKGSTSIALGNVIGSCVLNILIILGLTSVITPLTPEGITTIDLTMLFLGALLMWFFSFTKKTMERWEGAVLFLIFIAYMSYLLYNA